MAGKFKGVQKIIRGKHPNALYVHCSAHFLNLAVSSSSNIKPIRNCLGVIEKLNLGGTLNEINVKQDVIPPSTIDEESTEEEIRHAILVDRQLFDDENDPMNDGAAEDYHPDTTMFLERILAQNSLDVKLFWSNDMKMIYPENESHLESLLDQKVFGLTYCFTLTLLGDTDKGLAVRCMHWNETEKHLLVVVYSNLMYTDYADKQYAYVAVWSMKNQHRFYELNTSAITCLKFSIKTPNNLAIGFDCGIIKIIDISKKISQHCVSNVH
eukprot:XP_016661978.1 PREDICTED: uncharacterized protein LOC107884440 [Acyrthosiphon pisum]